MNEFSKIYVPILGGILLFTGFWYVKAYFSYLSLGEILPQLRPDYIIQFSFAVLYELLTFRSFYDTGVFCGLILFLVLVAYGLPKVRLSIHRWLPAWAVRVWGTNGFPLFPFAFRVMAAAGVSFVVLFHLSDRIGATHACQYLQGSYVGLATVAPIFVDKEQHASWFQNLEHAEKELAWSRAVIIDTAQLIQLWRTIDTIYLGTRVKSCSAPRLVFKVTTEHFPVVRHLIGGP